MSKNRIYEALNMRYYLLVIFAFAVITINARFFDIPQQPWVIDSKGTDSLTQARIDRTVDQYFTRHEGAQYPTDPVAKLARSGEMVVRHDERDMPPGERAFFAEKMKTTPENFMFFIFYPHLGVRGELMAYFVSPHERDDKWDEWKNWGRDFAFVRNHTDEMKKLMAKALFNLVRDGRADQILELQQRILVDTPKQAQERYESGGDRDAIINKSNEILLSALQSNTKFIHEGIEKTVQVLLLQKGWDKSTNAQERQVYQLFAKPTSIVPSNRFFGIPQQPWVIDSKGTDSLTQARQDRTVDQYFLKHEKEGAYPTDPATKLRMSYEVAVRENADSLAGKLAATPENFMFFIFYPHLGVRGELMAYFVSPHERDDKWDEWKNLGRDFAFVKDHTEAMKKLMTKALFNLIRDARADQILELRARIIADVPKQAQERYGSGGDRDAIINKSNEILLSALQSNTKFILEGEGSAITPEMTIRELALKKGWDKSTNAQEKEVYRLLVGQSSITPANDPNRFLEIPQFAWVALGTDSLTKAREDLKIDEYFLRHEGAEYPTDPVLMLKKSVDNISPYASQMKTTPENFMLINFHAHRGERRELMAFFVSPHEIGNDGSKWDEWKNWGTFFHFVKEHTEGMKKLMSKALFNLVRDGKADQIIELKKRIIEDVPIQAQDNVDTRYNETRKQRADEIGARSENKGSWDPVRRIIPDPNQPDLDPWKLPAGIEAIPMTFENIDDAIAENRDKYLVDKVNDFFGRSVGLRADEKQFLIDTVNFLKDWTNERNDIIMRSREILVSALKSTATDQFSLEDGTKKTAFQLATEKGWKNSSNEQEKQAYALFVDVGGAKEGVPGAGTSTTEGESGTGAGTGGTESIMTITGMQEQGVEIPKYSWVTAPGSTDSLTKARADHKVDEYLLKHEGIDYPANVEEKLKLATNNLLTFVDEAKKTTFADMLRKITPEDFMRINFYNHQGIRGELMAFFVSPHETENAWSAWRNWGEEFAFVKDYAEEMKKLMGKALFNLVRDGKADRIIALRDLIMTEVPKQTQQNLDSKRFSDDKKRLIDVLASDILVSALKSDIKYTNTNTGKEQTARELASEKGWDKSTNEQEKQAFALFATFGAQPEKCLSVIQLY